MRSSFLVAFFALAAPAAAFDLACSTTTTATNGGTAPADAAPDAPHADGRVTDWASAPTMLAPRANHCSGVAVTSDGKPWLVVVGGNDKPKGATDFVNLDAVEVAPIADDGSLGSWTKAGVAPSAVTGCTLAVDGAHLILVAGIFEDASKSGHVWTVDLDPSGALASKTWSDAGPLPASTSVLYAPAWIDTARGALVTFHGKLPDEGNVTTLLRAPYARGKLDTSAWSDDPILPGFLARDAFAFDTASGHAYVMGGYDSDDAGALTPVAGSHVASVDGPPSSPPGAAAATTPLPKPLVFGGSVVIDGYVFVVGGKTSVLDGSGLPDVLSAAIAADGSLGAWSQQSGMPQGRTSHAVAAYGSFLYVTGGGYDGPGLDTVYVARVRF